MTISAGLGLSEFPFSGGKAFWQWVDLCESGRDDSSWQSDRVVSREPHLECMSVMAALAGRTQRLKFGMNVVVLPFRDPLVLAKQCATIDYLSNGRLLPAFGVGRATAPEFTGAGRSGAQRGAWTDEVLQLFARLWSEDSVTFEGDHISYHDVTIEPKPVQSPLPIWIGGSSKAAIREQSAAEGRPIDDDHYGAGFAYRFGSWDDPIVQRTAAALSRVADAGDPRDYIAVGDASDIRARLDEYIAAGASKFVLRPLAETPEEVFAQTDRLIEEVIPAVHS